MSSPTASLVAPAGRLWRNPKQLRLFSSTRQRPRSRRATDVLLLVGALIGATAIVQAAHPPSAFERSLGELAASLPALLDIVWLALIGALTAWGAVLVVASLVRLRIDLVRDLLLSGAGAVALAAAGQHLLDHPGAVPLRDTLTATGPPAADLSLRLAVVVAATAVASPHLSRPFRALSRWAVVGGGIGLLAVEATTPSGVILSVLCGTAAAAAVHLALGSSGGLPSLRDVSRALADLGVRTDEIAEATRQRAGVFLVDATDTAGHPLLVKVYGRDAWDAQLLAKAWRALWYRDAEALTLTRLQQAEHEAFVTLLAASKGVAVDEVVSAGRSTGNDAVLVVRRRGTAVTDLPGPLTTAQLGALWDTLTQLQRAGLAHGDLAPARFAIDGDRAVVRGLGTAIVSPSGDQRQMDVAQLLVTTVVLTSPDEALAVAGARLGPEGLAAVVPYLQVAALGQQLRTDVKAAEVDLDALRTQVAGAAEVDEPTMAKLRRVSRATLLRAVVLAFAAYFLLSSLAGIDFAQMADQLRDATWGILVVALFLGQAPRLAQAEAARGACPRPVAYGPLALLQFAITFVNLVVPSTAARVGVNIRFFQRQGIPPASAVSIGVIDGLGGFVVQALVLVGVFVVGLGDIQLDLDREPLLDGVSILTIVLVLAGVLVLATLVALALPAVRHRVLDRIRPWFAEVRETVGSMRSPVKIAQVIGGNLLSELLFASTMAVVLSAFHHPVPLGTLLVINVAVSLFAGIMPVPGGIGVTEGGLILGLTAAGVDEATAFAATISYRMITFYLPPIWGAAAFRRLERTGYL